MTKRPVFLIVSLLIVAALCYVFYLNPHAVVVHLSPSTSVSYPMALTLIVDFCLGVCLTALAAYVVGINYRYRLWSLDRREKQSENHRALIVSAREHLSAGLLSSARDRLQKILAKDPKDTVARVQLAESYLQENRPQEALQVLEEARTQDKSNIELLFLAAETNRALGNVTGAYDNYQLILRREPRSPRALAGLVSCCRALERYEEAVQHQIQVLRNSRGVEQTKLQEELADLEVRKVEQRYPEAGKEYRKALEEILVRHREYPEALRLLAGEEREALRIDSAAKLLIRAYRSSRRVENLELLADLWLQAEEPAKAVAAVRAAVMQDESANAADRLQIESRMFLVALLLYLENKEEAKAERKKLDLSVVGQHQLSFGLKIIDSWLAFRDGEIVQAYEELFQNLAEEIRLPGYFLFHSKGNGADRTDHWVSRLKSRRAIEWRPGPEDLMSEISRERQ